MMKIGLHGDTHAGYDGSQGGEPAGYIHQQIVDKFIEAGVEHVVNFGDHVHISAVDPWPAFQSIVAPLSGAAYYWPVFGNHEDKLGFIGYFDKLPGNGGDVSYFFRAGNVLFVVLEVYNAAEAPPSCTDYSQQIAWLDTVLAQARECPIKVVCWHRPAYSTALRGSDLCARAFVPTLQKHKVKIVFSGHAHAYERFEIGGIQWAVSGGAGGVPHPLNVSPETGALLPFRMADSEAYNYGVMEITETATAILAHTKFYDLEDTVLDSFWVTGSFVEPLVEKKPTVAVE